MQEVLENPPRGEKAEMFSAFTLSMNGLKSERGVPQSETCLWAKAGKAQSGKKLELRAQTSDLESTWFWHMMHFPAGSICIQGSQGFQKCASCVCRREGSRGSHELVFGQAQKPLEPSLLVLTSVEIFQKCPPPKDSADLQQIYCSIWETAVCTQYLNIVLSIKKTHNSVFLKELHLW